MCQLYPTITHNFPLLDTIVRLFPHCQAKVWWKRTFFLFMDSRLQTADQWLARAKIACFALPRANENVEDWTARWGSRPISRVLSRAAIHLGRASPRASSGRPGNGAGHAMVPLLGLAPGGVCPATGVTTGAVRSYRTFSPLPPRGRYIFCGTFRGLAPPRHYLAPCPMEPGLSSPPSTQDNGHTAQLSERGGEAAAWPAPTHSITRRGTAIRGSRM